MDKNNQIKLTLDIVKNIYQQVSQVIQIIEEYLTLEKINNHFYAAQNSKKCTWDSSTSLNFPEKWYQSFFVRYYTEKSRTKSNKKKGYRNRHMVRWGAWN